MRKSRLSLAAPPLILLSACNAAPQSRPVLTADVKASLSRICNVPLSSRKLERAERVVIRYANDPDVLGAIGDLDAQDQMARICRGMQ
jgi:hypothetical protein